MPEKESAVISGLMGDVTDDEITVIQDRLAAIEGERAVLESRLAALLAVRMDRRAAADEQAVDRLVTAASSPAAKIALFRSLFRGREDVFPKRWSNPRTGKSGYAPACANEWKPRLCDKPKVKCGDCPRPCACRPSAFPVSSAAPNCCPITSLCPAAAAIRRRRCSVRLASASVAVTSDTRVRQSRQTLPAR